MSSVIQLFVYLCIHSFIYSFCFRGPRGADESRDQQGGGGGGRGGGKDVTPDEVRHGGV